jgi:hypothetical protein
MGYLSAPSAEKVTYTSANVTVVGPPSCEVRSYHNGPSSKEAFLSARKAAKAVMTDRRAKLADKMAEAICRRLEFRL